MISVAIRITSQEVIDFPKHTLVCDPKWNDIIDPQNDGNFKRKRTTKKRKIA